MVTINNEELRNTFNYLSTIENVIQKESRQINGNKQYLDKIVPENIINVYSKKHKDAITFADSLTRTSYENSIVTLVATFERILFAKYKTTFGALKIVVRDNSGEDVDFYKSRERFVYGSIDNLYGLIGLIDGHVSKELIDKLKIIKNHRNFIAHGKRDYIPPPVEFKLDEAAKILDDIIKEVEH